MEANTDCLIVTFKSEEFNAVLQQFSEPEIEVSKGAPGNSHIFSVLTRNKKKATILVVRTPDQGNISALDFMNTQLARTSPKLVLAVGIAGAMATTDILLGDVLVVTRIHDFTLGADTELGREEAVRNGYIPDSVREFVTNLASENLGEWQQKISRVDRPNAMNLRHLGPDVGWNNKLKEVQDLTDHQESSRFTDGPIASSDAVVKNPKTARRWLRSDRKILGCDMESAGVAKACESADVPLLVVRGISDIIGLERSDEWERYACEAASSFARELLELDCVDIIARNRIGLGQSTDQSNSTAEALRQSLARIRKANISETASECRTAFALFKKLPEHIRRLQALELFTTLDKPMKFLGDKQFVLEVANACIECCEGDAVDDTIKELEARARICGTSWGYQRVGKLDLAKDEADKALQISEGIGSSINLAFCKKCMGRLMRLKAEKASNPTLRNEFYAESVKLLNEAISEFSGLRSHGPGHSEVGDCYSLMGRTYFSMNNLTDARNCMEKARTRIDNQNKDYLDLCILDGDILAFDENYSAAILAYDDVIVTKDNRNYQYSEIVARAHLQKGRALVQLDEKSRAIVEFEKAAEIWKHYFEWDFAAIAEWERIVAMELLNDRELRLLNNETHLIRYEAFKISQERLERTTSRALAQRRGVNGLDDAVWKSCIREAKHRLATRQET